MRHVIPGTSPSAGGRADERFAVVDIAGVAWPVYKVEALILGVMVFAGVMATNTAPNIAVLVSTATTVAAWWLLRVAETRALR